MKKRSMFILSVAAAIMIASCETALEENLSEKKVILAAPVNHLVTSDSLQTFFWYSLDGAFRYQLQVVSPSFDSIVKLISDTIIDKTKISLSLKKASFQWRVRALNNGSATSFCDPWNLKIQ